MLGKRLKRLAWDLPQKGLRFWRSYGTVKFLARITQRISRKMGFGFPKPLPIQQAKAWEDTFLRQPKISIVVPVFQTPKAWLDACVSSVQSQYYQHWELILVDDHSQQPEFTARLNEHMKSDPRIQVVSLPKNAGIAGATNVGIQAATGEFIGFLDHDDELTPDCLTYMVAAHNRHPKAVWFYSDEDKITEAGKRDQPYLPYFKPAYSPEFLLSNMYTCHFSLYSRELLEQVGGLRLGFDGSQDHDLALRISEQVQRDQVVHIPRVLYHWRKVAGSTAADNQAKPLAAINGLKAVREALVRRGLTGDVQSHPQMGTAYQIRLAPRSTPSVRIFIPTYNAFSDLKTCLDSIEKLTRYPNHQITVIDNRSDDLKLLHYLKQAKAQGRLDVVRDLRPFNHSQMHNDAIANCDEDYLVFMNNDVELLTEGWLEQLIATAEIDNSIAGVGGLLLYPDRSVQHGGIYLGRMGVAGHAHQELSETDPGYFGQAHLLRETYAATAALVLMKRSAFNAVNGFDAARYPVSFNDVDLWIRLQQLGYRCLYNPQVRAIHHEQKTRKINKAEEQEKIKTFQTHWGHVTNRDPFYNPNLNPIYPTCSEWLTLPAETVDQDVFRCLPVYKASCTTTPTRRAA